MSEINNRQPLDIVTSLRARDGSTYEVRIREVARSEVKAFIENNHYSHSINGVRSTHCYAVYYSDTIVGAALFGTCGMANQYKKYTENELELLELRRFVAIDDTPRNFESFVISRMIKDLKRKGYKKILSYSDPVYGHYGIIYKALGFTYLGQVPTQKVINFNGRLYHDKTIRTRYTKTGEIKPYAKRIIAALVSGEAKYVKVEGKLRWLLTLN